MFIMYAQVENQEFGRTYVMALHFLCAHRLKASVKY